MPIKTNKVHKPEINVSTPRISQQLKKLRLVYCKNLSNDFFMIVFYIPPFLKLLYDVLHKFTLQSVPKIFSKELPTNSCRHKQKDKGNHICLSTRTRRLLRYNRRFYHRKYRFLFLNFRPAT